MDEERIENAVQRIEAALARIHKIAEEHRLAPPLSSAEAAALESKHEALREKVNNALLNIDNLIAKIEQ